MFSGRVRFGRGCAERSIALSELGGVHEGHFPDCSGSALASVSRIICRTRRVAKHVPFSRRFLAMLRFADKRIPFVPAIDLRL